MHQSPVARGLFVQDEDTGSSPLAPLGLHALRLRMKPSRVIQTVRSLFYLIFYYSSVSFYSAYTRLNGRKVTPRLPSLLPASLLSLSIPEHGCDNCGYLIALDIGWRSPIQEERALVGGFRCPTAGKQKTEGRQ